MSETIEELRQENERLREALRGLEAELAESIDHERCDERTTCPWADEHALVEKARAALAAADAAPNSVSAPRPARIARSAGVDTALPWRLT